MKILITVDTEDSDLSVDSPRAAYRMVDWPSWPNQGEDIYPFIVNSDVDRTVIYVGHYFARGYVYIVTVPFSADHLAELLNAELDDWVISTTKNFVSEYEAAKRFLSE